MILAQRRSIFNGIYQVFFKNKRLISFGFSLTFFSSFGQTFLLYLYVPAILKEFDLSRFSFGLIYGAATIMSGLTLAVVGKIIDRSQLRQYTLTAVFLLIFSCLLSGFSLNPAFLFISLF